MLVIWLLLKLVAFSSALTSEEGDCLCTMAAMQYHPSSFQCPNIDSACTWTPIVTCTDGNITALVFSAPPPPQTLLISSIPDCIGSFTSLTSLQYNGISMNGSIPTTIGLLTSLLDLEIISISNLTGTIPTEIGLLTRLTTLNYNTLGMSGAIPTTIGLLTSLLDLQIIQISGLTGPIPTEIGFLTQLTTLDINELTILTGTIPTEIGLLTRVQHMDLSANFLISSTFPTEIGTLTALSSLSLQQCNFSGPLPTQVFLPLLQNLQINLNQFGGTIPTQIGLSPILLTFNANSNNFTGTLPTQVANCNLLQYLQVASQTVGLTGTLPSQLSTLTSLIDLDVHSNAFTGTIPDLSASAASFTTLQASYNQFSGPMPLFYGVNPYQYLQTLVLNNNLFSGSITTQLLWLRLTKLSIAHNNFSGTPIFAIEYTSWNYFDVSNNRLTGIYLFGGVEDAALDFTYNYISDSYLTAISVSAESVAIDFEWYPQYCVSGETVCPALTSCQSQPGVAGPSCYCIPGLTEDYVANLTFTCVDVQECITGAWAVNKSKNTGEPCPLRQQCVNIYGSFNCCATGYYNPDITQNNATCVDFDECTNSASNCTSGQFCFNTPGSFECLECSNTTIGKIINPSQNTTYSALRNFNQSFYGFRYMTCFGPCDGPSYQFFSGAASSCSSVVSCTYACTNITSSNTQESAITTLMTQFNADNFLDDVISKIYGAHVTITKRRATSTLTLSVTPCDNITQISQLIYGLAMDIAPNAPNLQVVPDSSQCGLLTLSSSNPSGVDKSAIIGGVVGGVCGALLCLLLLAFILYLAFKPSILKHLPEGVAWSFQLYEQSYDWTYRGTKTTGYYFKEFERGSKHYHRAQSLFSTFGKHEFQTVSVKAIYNPVLITNFVGSYLIQRERMRSAPSVFGEKRFTGANKHMEHKWVNSHYEKIVQLYPWNQNNTAAVIIPLCHGTDLAVAEKICETGFASLSSVDEGYFGKGIYFTSFSMYCIPYIFSRRNPTIVISYILPGNVYPVVEDINSPESLLGSAMKSGYNSHFVVTDRKGKCIIAEKQEMFNEFVIPQEGQIVPAFLFEFESDSLIALGENWHRALPKEYKRNEKSSSMTIPGRQTIVD